MSDCSAYDSASKQKKTSSTKKGASGTSRSSTSTEATSSVAKTSSTTTKIFTASTLISNIMVSASARSSRSSATEQKLSKCTLALQGTILTIGGWTGAAKDVTVNLNQYVAYIGDKLQWVSRGTGGFRSRSEEKSIRLEEGAILVASCREGDSGNYRLVRLDLNGCITYNSVTNVFQPNELGFNLVGAEKIVDSSRSLMHVTLISRLLVGNAAKYHPVTASLIARSSSQGGSPKFAGSLSHTFCILADT
ncbi:hypothetical protein K438DRAFT_2002027 [Mycena galopus ATCC 62051]|nr:hypothetical protein K438DRAFT_2002027 [Mycena galopus ATCC 62051]